MEKGCSSDVPGPVINIKTMTLCWTLLHKSFLVDDAFPFLTGIILDLKLQNFSLVQIQKFDFDSSFMKCKYKFADFDFNMLTIIT